MIEVSVTIKGNTPYSPCAPIQEPKKIGQTPAQAEAEHWQKRINVGPDGIAYIPAMAIKNCLSEVAKFLGETVPGKGKATWTKHFEAGIIVPANISLGVGVEAFEIDERFVPASGVRGDGKRVWKKFPVLKQWSGSFSLFLVDPIFQSQDGLAQIKKYMSFAGVIIGLGRWRPRNNGCNGRFDVTSFEVKQVYQSAD